MGTIYMVFVGCSEICVRRRRPDWTWSHQYVCLINGSVGRTHESKLIYDGCCARRFLFRIRLTLYGHLFGMCVPLGRIWNSRIVSRPDVGREWRASNAQSSTSCIWSGVCVLRKVVGQAHRFSKQTFMHIIGVVDMANESMVWRMLTAVILNLRLWDPFVFLRVY